ncbi:16923_t:CDS:2, partial [Funneliformis caledonium]
TVDFGESNTCMLIGPSGCEKTACKLGSTRIVSDKLDNKYLEDKYRDSVNIFQKLDKETNESLTELANYEQEDIDWKKERDTQFLNKRKLQWQFL